MVHAGTFIECSMVTFNNQSNLQPCYHLHSFSHLCLLPKSEEKHYAPMYVDMCFRGQERARRYVKKGGKR